MITQTAETIEPAQTFTVYYRTGGRDNFKWQRVMERYTTQAAAQEKARELERMGYRALWEDTERLDHHGLPESYDADSFEMDYISSTWDGVTG